MGRKKLSYEEKLELLEKFWEAHKRIRDAFRAIFEAVGIYENRNLWWFSEEEWEKYLFDWIYPDTLYFKRCILHPEIEAKYKERLDYLYESEQYGTFYYCMHEKESFKATELIRRFNLKTSLTEEDLKKVDEAYDFLETVDLRQLPKVIPMANPNDPESVIYLTFGDPNDFWEGRWGWDDEDDDEDDLSV